MGGQMEGRVNLPRGWLILVWLVVGIIAVVVILEVPWMYLQFSIYQSVYSLKAGLDWFTTVFYHGYIFVAAALFPLLLINPKIGHSDLFRLIKRILGTTQSRSSGFDSDDFANPEPRPAELNNTDWAVWQFIKWGFGFILFMMTEGPLFVGPVMNSVMMMAMGYGSWSTVPRIFLLPLFPVSGSELINLMPTLEVQYWLLQATVNAFLVIFGIRMFLRLLANRSAKTTRLFSSPWLANLLAILVAIFLGVIFGAPYWVMDVETPYVYGVVWVLLALSVWAWIYVRLSGRNLLESFASRRTRLKGVGILLVLILFIQLGALMFYSLNWNNNYIPYLWTPQTQKKITVTDWAAGISGISRSSLATLPTSNTSTILSLIRQWDQQAAATTMTKEVGAYNWMSVASSEIVFYNSTEYWVAPTTPAFPTLDWISGHMIYTHASRVMIINTHSGAQVSLRQAFNVSYEPLIYYGEEPPSGVPGGFVNNVYVGVPDYVEIANQSYPNVPDYTLTGWQKAFWFTFAEGQVGFAFSSYPINMLWNRDIFNRVQDILISGLTTDPAAYMVSDGENVYYCIQVYINYPIRSMFSSSPYLRFFGVVLVNVESGSLQGYTVSNLVGSSSLDFLTSFYERYYSSWGSAPDWLMPQIRYPEQLLGKVGTLNPLGGVSSIPGQLDYDFMFHVTDPFVWRSGSQFYTRPTMANTVQYIPWAVGNKTYLVGVQLVEFQNSTSQNLAGIYIIYGGDRLGQIYIYQNPSPSNTFIGPTAAQNALSTNSEVRTQETLLPNYRLGSYLLYSVGGTLAYFIAIYTNPGFGGVVTKLPFMTAVDPTTGNVGIGTDATAAYVSLTSGVVVAPPPSANASLLLNGIASLVTGSGYKLINATTVSFPIQIRVESIKLSSAGVNQTVAKVGEFLASQGPGSKFGNVVYAWTGTAGVLDVGVVEQTSLGYYVVYYVEIQL